MATSLYPVSKLTMILALACCAHFGLASNPFTDADASGSNDEARYITQRLRAKGTFTTFQATTGALQAEEASTTDLVKDDGDDAFMEMIETVAVDEFMSMDQGIVPPIVITDEPTSHPSGFPSLSPTIAPTTFTPAPTVSMLPSVAPSISQAPSPSEPAPTELPSTTPTGFPTASPSASPSISPSAEAETLSPTDAPSFTPTDFPSILPTDFPTSTPTVEGCTVSADVRVAAIMAILDNATDPALNRNISTSQGRATEWILNEDPRVLCPDNPKILQRWVLAVIYFSTGGDNWFQCSNSLFAADDCGNEDPFEGEQRFLSAFQECEWAGIECDNEDCVTEIEFELNNLIGTIPTEIAHLTGLVKWGMERGGLRGTIPTEIARLTKLDFLDLDFNELTGSLTTQLLSLSTLTQLDLNNNLLTGSINGIGDVYPNITFLQLHDNQFTGTVPEGVGLYSNLEAFTIHETDISGVMPDSVCDLLTSNNPNGFLSSLIADCRGGNPDVECDCCTDCRRNTRKK